MAAEKADKANKTHLRENEKKWGRDLLEPGWSLVPNILLSKQHALGLEPIDINIILQIAKHWWKADERPFPSQAQLAKQMNVDRSTVNRRLQGLRAAGLIQWSARRRSDGGNASNEYDLSGLIAKATEFALEETAARRTENEARKKRRARRRARPTKASSAHLEVLDGGGDE